MADLAHCEAQRISAEYLKSGREYKFWEELYKNRSSRKTDSQLEKRSLGSPILLKMVSENRFSGKTYFIQLVPGMKGGGAAGTA